MKYQVILSTAVVAILLASDIRPLLAQPFAPGVPAIRGASQPVNSSHNLAQPTRPSPEFVPVSGAPRIATLSNISATAIPQATSQNRVINDVYEPTTVLATVGPEYILAGDMIPQVEMVKW